MKATETERDTLGRHRLWIHCPGLLESQLTEYFCQFGSGVTDIYIPRDRFNGARKNFGFATFADEEGLRRTLEHGPEHIIAGKVVRVNLAGPRPELPLAFLQQQQQQPRAAVAPAAAGTTTMMGPAAVQAPQQAPMLQQQGVWRADGVAGAAQPRGSGPRIYVGGIPTAVSETMVRNHFTQWGAVTDVYFPKDRFLNRRKNFCFVTFATQQAAEKAAAQSDREINGYRIESISITHDRQEHYQRQGTVVSQGTQPGGAERPDQGGMRWMGTSARGVYPSPNPNALARAPSASYAMPLARPGMPGAGGAWPVGLPAGMPAGVGLPPQYGALPQMTNTGSEYGGSPQGDAGGAPAGGGGGGYGRMDAMFGSSATSQQSALQQQQQAALAAQMAQYYAMYGGGGVPSFSLDQLQQAQAQALSGVTSAQLGGAGGPLMNLGAVAAALPDYPLSSPGSAAQGGQAPGSFPDAGAGGAQLGERNSGGTLSAGSAEAAAQLQQQQPPMSLAEQLDAAARVSSAVQLATVHSGFEGLQALSEGAAYTPSHQLQQQQPGGFY